MACNVIHFLEEFAEDEEVSGKLQLLFGLNVAQYYPAPVKSQGSIVLFEKVYGFCVGGTLSDGHCDRFPKVNLSLTKVNLSDFLDLKIWESLAHRSAETVNVAIVL